MKKWMKICLIVLCVVLLWEILAWIGGLRINPFAVEKATLYSYDDETGKYHSAKLTAEEAWKIVLLYNFCTTHMGTAVVDGPTEPDIVELQMEAGGEVTMLPLRGDRLSIKPGYLNTYNLLLRDYIRELLEKCELPVW